MNFGKNDQKSGKRIVVIGGGPAGLLAAGQAAVTGADVTLLEKMDRPGLKLSITGKGRCNLTNVLPLPEFIAHFGANGRFLRNGFSRFFTSDLLAFLKDLGIETMTERGGRVFPVSEDARLVVQALVKWAGEQGVRIRTGVSVNRILVKDNRIAGVGALVRMRGKEVYEETECDRIVVAAGGSSYPGTGSTGDGYRLASQSGHTITSILPALVPLVTAGDTAPRLQGLSLRNVSAVLLIDGKKDSEQFGEMLFTHFGLSGPIILTLSHRAAEALNRKSRVEIAVDLKPALDEKKLDNRLLRELDAGGKQNLSTVIGRLLPRKLVPVCIDLLVLPPEKVGHQVTAGERKRLRNWLKDFRFHVIRTKPLAEAIVTCGGVDLREIDPKTMASRLVDGLYFAGEVLDIDGDTGGFNLQAAFSTGWLAGRSAASL